jgi:hypothetical protein
MVGFSFLVPGQGLRSSRKKDHDAHQQRQELRPANPFFIFHDAFLYMTSVAPSLNGISFPEERMDSFVSETAFHVKTKRRQEDTPDLVPKK